MYDIVGQGLAIFEELEENGGELTTEIQEALTITKGELQSKGIAYIEVIGQRKSYVDRIDIEIKRLQAMKKSNQNLVDLLENKLLDAVKLFGDIEMEFTTITTRKSESIEVEDVNSLPPEYKNIKVVETADKIALKNAIKLGAKIEGVQLIENLNLKIK